MSVLRTILVALAALLAAGTARADVSGFGRSFAVVIGISDYAHPAWPKLTYPRKDARGIAAFLKAQGFQITELYDAQATRQRILAALEDDLLGKLRPGDRVLLFYSGHGHTRTFGGADYGYLVPYDGTDQLGSLISMDSLHVLSRKMANARHQLFIMDACFGGQLAPKASAMPAVAPEHPDYIGEITRRPARQYLTAGGGDQQVLDGGPKGYSYFTGYLLEALADGLGDVDGDGYITATELAGYLIPRATNPYQTPGAGTLPGHGLGDFVFRVGKGAAVARTTPVTGDAAPKGQDQTAALPPARETPEPTPAAPAGGLARLVSERGDEARQAMTNLLRRTEYGRLSTAKVRSLKVLDVVQDGPDEAVIRVRYEAVVTRLNYQTLEDATVRVRLDGDRLRFEKGP